MMPKKTMPPCGDCKARAVGCHSMCGKYRAWQETHAEELAAEARRLHDKHDADKCEQLRYMMGRGKKRFG